MENLSQQITELKAELRRREHEIRDLEGELALVRSIAYYRLTLLQARTPKLLPPVAHQPN